MVRLINDSGILQDKIEDLDNISFDQMVEAIHVVQTNMDITGTTAKEAATTIQGSWSALKASWTNLLVGMADENQDIGPLMEDLAETASTAFQQILPKIEQTLKSIPTLISGIAPEISPAIQELLPSLIDATVSLINGLIEAMPEILDALWESLPTMLDGIWQILTNISNELGLVADAIGVVAVAYGAWELGSKLDDFANGLKKNELLTSLLTGKITLAEFASAMWAKTQAILNGVLSANPIGVVVMAIAALIAIGVILYNKCEGFRNFINGLWEKIKEIIAGVKEKIEELVTKVKQVFTDIKDAITEKIEDAKNTVKSAIDKIKSFFDFKWELPKLKMPHIKIQGEFSLLPPKVPKFSIDWYKEGGILKQPTIFGFNPFKNSAMVGGEAGAEAIAPISELQGYVRSAVREQNMTVEDVLYSILELLNDYLPQLQSRKLMLDTGTIVGELTAPIDNELGVIKRRKDRS